ncbi:MAG: UDP binding domain-containing protein [Candidatus Bathyarchaeia archaeon]
MSFKPDTDDIREARSIPITNQLLNEGANIIAYDPVAIPNAESIFRDKIEYAHSTIECLKDTDCCILITEWEEFKKLRPKDFIQHMKTPVLIDGRRIYDPKQFSGKLKFKAIGLGQQQISSRSASISPSVPTPTKGVKRAQFRILMCPEIACFVLLRYKRN